MLAILHTLKELWIYTSCNKQSKFQSLLAKQHLQRRMAKRQQQRPHYDARYVLTDC